MYQSLMLEIDFTSEEMLLRSCNRRFVDDAKCGGYILRKNKDRN